MHHGFTCVHYTNQNKKKIAPHMKMKNPLSSIWKMLLGKNKNHPNFQVLTVHSELSRKALNDVLMLALDFLVQKKWEDGLISQNGGTQSVAWCGHTKRWRWGSAPLNHPFLNTLLAWRLIAAGISWPRRASRSQPASWGINSAVWITLFTLMYILKEDTRRTLQFWNFKHQWLAKG